MKVQLWPVCHLFCDFRCCLPLDREISRPRPDQRSANMDRVIRRFRRRSPVEEIIDQYAEEGPEAVITGHVTVSEGYKLITLQRPDVGVITVRRKLATWEANQQRDPLASDSDRAPSPTPTFRTIISRASDGRLVRIQRPVRDSTQSPIPSAAPSTTGSVPGYVSNRSSSVYSARPQRDTMETTMTIVDTALAEQRSHQGHRHSRRDGSSTTTGSAGATSAASGNIQIGHIEEAAEDYYTSVCSTSDSDEEERHLNEREDVGNFSVGRYHESGKTSAPLRSEHH